MAKLQTLREILPTVIARPLFQVLMPGRHRFLTGLRKHSPIDVHDRSLKPLIDNKCIFVHIPKTAGISIGRSLFGCVTGGHMTMLDYQMAFSSQELRDFYKFTIVRNPWDRAVSAYFYLMAGGRNETDRHDRDKIISKYKNFEDFVKGYIYLGRLEQKHFRPQYKFLCTSPRGAPQVDFIGRFESLEDDFFKITRVLGADSKLQHENRSCSRKKDWRSFYSDETAEIVARTYARDIELFRYRFER